MGRFLCFLVILLPTLARAADVHVVGEMRRMFTAHDIAANVDLVEITDPHF